MDMRTLSNSYLIARTFMMLLWIMIYLDHFKISKEVIDEGDTSRSGVEYREGRLE